MHEQRFRKGTVIMPEDRNPAGGPADGRGKAAHHPFAKENHGPETGGGCPDSSKGYPLFSFLEKRGGEPFPGKNDGISGFRGRRGAGGFFFSPVKKCTGEFAVCGRKRPLLFQPPQSVDECPYFL
jgi:hypothetical protein